MSNSEYSVQTPCKAGICHTSLDTSHMHLLGKPPLRLTLQNPPPVHHSLVPSMKIGPVSNEIVYALHVQHNEIYIK